MSYNACGCLFSVSPPVATIYLIGKRSRYHLKYRTSSRHIRRFSSSNTSRFSISIHFTLAHYYASSTLYCLAAWAHHCICFLLRPATGMPLSSFWQVRALERSHNFSVFVKSIGSCEHGLIPIPSPNPRISPSVCPRSSHSSALAFLCFLCLILRMSWIPQTYLWTAFLFGRLLPGVSIHTSRLEHPTILQLALLLLSAIQLYHLRLATSFLARFSLFSALSTFSRFNWTQVGAFQILLRLVGCLDRSSKAPKMWHDEVNGMLQGSSNLPTTKDANIDIFLSIL